MSKKEQPNGTIVTDEYSPKDEFPPDPPSNSLAKEQLRYLWEDVMYDVKILYKFQVDQLSLEEQEEADRTGILNRYWIRFESLYKELK